MMPLELRGSKDNSFKYFVFPIFLKRLFPPHAAYDIKRLPDDEMSRLDG